MAANSAQARRAQSTASYASSNSYMRILILASFEFWSWIPSTWAGVELSFRRQVGPRLQYGFRRQLGSRPMPLSSQSGVARGNRPTGANSALFVLQLRDARF